jgi:ABC-type nitrate/sulfonate/bicarbonate transport system substrate-binding protein
MRPIAVLLFSFVLIHAPNHDALSAEKPKLARLRIGVASRSATVMPLFVARERGYFRDEGFEAEIIVMTDPPSSSCAASAQPTITGKSLT